ncbi:hypothetical protein TRFO_12904 [Tritrichomonas foetus]|uniref:E2F/DP family winged-helix DNA-binding domain-containing protein n=1 Tax=Tritrichomonas foetus TaxID=1144522 RepID=A0A1J4KZZ0_9EUKA|nr:hypothetical protein TRFO_12904 [Tritrichomonas foetus]|eukprot:OHT16823.1 hypothetical protein TRFO_12904 [Tritrichomonas foetus]
MHSIVYQRPMHCSQFGQYYQYFNLYKNESPKLSTIFSDMIIMFEKTKPQNLTVMGIARNRNIQHRRLYDFFNLLSSLGVCKMIQKGQLSWIGMHEITSTLKEWYAEIEIMAINQTVSDIFSFESSPSLGTIAMKFIGLYLYLNIDALSVRQVLAIFHVGNNDRKSFERRVYLVISCLEIIGLMKRSHRGGQYILLIPRDEIIAYGWNSRKDYCFEKFPELMEGLLSNINYFNLEKVYALRYKIFLGMMKKSIDN